MCQSQVNEGHQKYPEYRLIYTRMLPYYTDYLVNPVYLK